jgi:hypothetical protein
MQLYYECSSGIVLFTGTKFGYWEKLDFLFTKFIQTIILSTRVVKQASDLGFYITIKYTSYKPFQIKHVFIQDTNLEFEFNKTNMFSFINKSSATA